MYLYFCVDLNSHNHKTPVLEKDTNFVILFQNSKLSQISELDLFNNHITLNQIKTT